MPPDLSSAEAALAHFRACIKADPCWSTGFTRALSEIVAARGPRALGQQADVSAPTLFRLARQHRAPRAYSPRLATTVALLDAMGLCLQVVPKTQATQVPDETA